MTSLPKRYAQCNTNALLLPPYGSDRGFISVELTEEREVSLSQAWRWATGNIRTEEISLRESLKWAERLGPLADAAQAAALAGIPAGKIRALTNQAIEEGIVARQAAEWAEGAGDDGR